MLSENDFGFPKIEDYDDFCNSKQKSGQSSKVKTESDTEKLLRKREREKDVKEDNKEEKDEKYEEKIENNEQIRPIKTKEENNANILLYSDDDQ